MVFVLDVVILNVMVAVYVPGVSPLELTLTPTFVVLVLEEILERTPNSFPSFSHPALSDTVHPEIPLPDKVSVNFWSDSGMNPVNMWGHLRKRESIAQLASRQLLSLQPLPILALRLQA